MNALTGFAAFVGGPSAGGICGAPSRAKRVLDLALVALALPVLIPLALVIALAIKVSSRGPVFFRQIRIGQGGRPFDTVKFRSMVVDAEARRAEVLGLSDREGLCFKAKPDRRVTRVGRVLRRASLDELPQLLSVVRGEMSLVGPRPALPEEVAAYPAPALERLAVLPGITGPWQVAGRANLGFDAMVALDIGYVHGASLATDLAILGKTVRAVASGRGAY